MSLLVSAMRRPVTAIALAMVTFAACTAQPQRMPSPTPPSPTPMATYLAAVTVSDATLPVGLHVDHTDVGRAVLTYKVISGREATFLALEGFVEGRYTESSGDSGLLLSLALAFDTVEHAEAAFDLYIDELLSDAGYGWGSETPPGFGDAGTCAEGPNPALGGIHENACVWRNGTLVMIAGGTDRSVVHDVAVGMDARAP